MSFIQMESDFKLVNKHEKFSSTQEDMQFYILGEIGSFQMYSQLQLIIVKRDRVIIKYKGNPNITFHNFVCHLLNYRKEK